MFRNQQTVIHIYTLFLKQQQFTFLTVSDKQLMGKLICMLGRCTHLDLGW